MATTRRLLDRFTNRGEKSEHDWPSSTSKVNKNPFLHSTTVIATGGQGLKNQSKKRNLQLCEIIIGTFTKTSDSFRVVGLRFYPKDKVAARRRDVCRDPQQNLTSVIWPREMKPVVFCVAINCCILMISEALPWSGQHKLMRRPPKFHSFSCAHVMACASPAKTV